MTLEITTDMLDAIKVQFLKSIFEDDFVERGMKAWLTGIEWDSRNECYNLAFDFKEFESENEKYFQATYYPNNITRALGIEKPLYTALESGNYTQKYSVCFSCGNYTTRDDAVFAQAIKEYLRVIE